MYFIRMKFIWGLLLALVLMLPSSSLATEGHFLNPGFQATLWDVSIGGGNELFVASADIAFGQNSLLFLVEDYSPRKDEEFMLLWTNRFRYVYDFAYGQHGFLFQPNIRMLVERMRFTLVVGPEVGWMTKNGFDYGFSIRVGGLRGLLGWVNLANYEVGYLANSRKVYIAAVISLPVFFF